MHVIQPAPVRKAVTVRADQERAFDIFVSAMGDWWLKSHSLTTSGQKTVVVEPFAGGRWYEIGNSGEEKQWGRVLACERPRRILFAWQLNADWVFDPDFRTEVEVTFEPTTDGGTMVLLEHRDIGNYGDKASEARAALDSEGGWAGLLAAFAAKAA
ncbi:ATPase [Ensifer adhaerens]|uniref:ATPase n=1 Tax=Ensifer adhaerens TaxID=106592 RepID=A0A0L8BEM8_ENSAD|nr:SRPBCC family protein [Ensifer adhaerens]KOF13015.1 ATPase [Ensifer adhaerens]